MVKGIALTVLKAARLAIKAIVGAMVRAVQRDNTANDRGGTKRNKTDCPDSSDKTQNLYLAIHY
jgi:hypothetical protein